MSQQVPFDNNGVPQGGISMEDGRVASGGYADAAPGSYAPQEMMPPNVPAGPAPYAGNSGGGGYWQPPQGPQTYARNKVPMIDPIESAKLTPQIMILLLLSGLERHWRWSLPLGLVLGLIAAGSLYLAFPLQHEATAAIQIRSAKPRILEEARQGGGNDNFVQTQLALMRSNVVITKALEDGNVAKLGVITKQKDKKAWVTKQVRVKTDGKSEIVTISIATDAEEASEKIVDAVVEAYLSFIDEIAENTDKKMLQDLQLERRRHVLAATNLQDSIRRAQIAATGSSASMDGGLARGIAQGESLMRDAALARAQLVSMQARAVAIKERVDDPNRIPSVILTGLNPQYARLVAEREALQQDKIGKMQFYQESDPRVQLIIKQIERVEESINKLSDAESGEMQAMRNAVRFQDVVDLFTLNQEIRAQEILVTELENRYAVQLKEASERTDKVAESAFLQTQLDRTNRTIDKIDDRILAVQSEQRAPGQVTLLSKADSSKPNRVRQLTVVGMGGIMAIFFPMALGIAIERMKPRLYHVSQVRRAIPQVLIGEIMEPPVSWVHGATFRKRLARYQESVHNWCTHLLLSDPFRVCRTLSIASVAGDDGKTFLAVQIAVAMAQMKPGNVLLIDGDMRVGRLHLLFGNEETGVGLADVLSFRHGFGEAVVQNEKEQNLHLLSAGQLDVSPYELLGDGRFRELLDMLEQSYSLILVVLPPVANAAESLIMASSTDSTLLCVRQRETVLGAMEDVYRKLVNTGASVDGIVVKDIPYYQMAGRDGGFADKLEQIRLSHLLQYAD